MKVLIQWAKKNASDWFEVDTSDIVLLPQKPVPDASSKLTQSGGWINAINVQGVVIESWDHYAFNYDPYDTTWLEVICWCDDPVHSAPMLNRAAVYRFEHLQEDPAEGGAWNTKQTRTYYGFSVPESKNTISGLPWEDFSKPTSHVFHGIMMDEIDYASHKEQRLSHGWREWTEGVPQEEIVDGKVRFQRPTGKYPKATGTLTFYPRALSGLIGGVNCDFEYKAGFSDVGTGENIASVRKSSSAPTHGYISEDSAAEIGTGDWPDGTEGTGYRLSIDVDTCGADITYGLLSSVDSNAAFYRYDTTATTQVDSAQQSESAFSGTGINTATNTTKVWSGSTATDRFCAIIGAANAHTKNNEDFGILKGSDTWMDGPWPGAAYVVDAQPGSFTLTGVAMTPVRGYVIDAQPTSYTLTGVAATLGKGYVVDAQPASFTLTGIDMTPVYARVIDAQPGSFDITGIEATLPYSRVINAEPASFVLTGIDATTLKEFLINAQPGSFMVTGVAMTPAYNRVVDAQPGAFTVTGVNATLSYGRFVNAEPASFTLTGIDSTLSYGRFIDAQPGSIVVTGVAATLAYGRVLNAEPAAFVLTGIDATTLKEFLINAEPGSFTLTGIGETPLWTRVLNAQPGAFTLTGIGATPSYNRVVNAESASFVLTGIAMNPQRGYVINAEPTSFTLTGIDMTPIWPRLMNAQPGSFVLTGVGMTPQRGYVINAEPTSFILTGIGMTPVWGRVINAEPAAFVLTGIEATTVYDSVGTPVSVDKILAFQYNGHWHKDFVLAFQYSGHFHTDNVFAFGYQGHFHTNSVIPIQYAGGIAVNRQIPIQLLARLAKEGVFAVAWSETSEIDPSYKWVLDSKGRTWAIDKEGGIWIRNRQGNWSRDSSSRTWSS